MNERIKELAQQAQEYAGQKIDEGANWDDAPIYYTEKFAELIVRECAQVAFEGDLKRAIGQWGSHSDILKHFEVEHDVVKTFRGEE
jgi:hypothetical protein